MSFDEILDLTAGVYLFFCNVRKYPSSSVHIHGPPWENLVGTCSYESPLWEDFVEMSLVRHGKISSTSVLSPLWEDLVEIFW